MSRWWWKRKDEDVDKELDNSAPNLPPNLAAVDQLPDQSPRVPETERLAGEGLELPEPAEDNDVCFCGAVELVYGGSVQVELTDGRRGTVIHRKDDPCEDLVVGEAPDGSHRYASIPTDPSGGLRIPGRYGSLTPRHKPGQVVEDMGDGRYRYAAGDLPNYHDGNATGQGWVWDER